MASWLRSFLPACISSVLRMLPPIAMQQREDQEREQADGQQADRQLAAAQNSGGARGRHADAAFEARIDLIASSRQRVAAACRASLRRSAELMAVRTFSLSCVYSALVDLKRVSASAAVSFGRPRPESSPLRPPTTWPM